MQLNFVDYTGPLISRMIIASLLLNIFLLVFLGISWQKIPPEVPLFYSLPWGEGQIIARGWLFIVPTVALLFTVIAFITNQLLKEKEPLILRILWGGSLFAAILGIITIMRIFSLL